MHLRRALLLFAIVLGLAAVAASVSRPRDDSDPSPPATTAPESQAAEPGPEAGGGQTELFFDAAAPRAQGMQVGQAATVYVAVPRPGQVGIADLGLGTTAEPLTAARFDVLPSRSGHFPITFAPAGGDGPQEAGTLVVRE